MSSKIRRCLVFDYITPVLKELHCLYVHKRIIFKLLVLTYRSIRGTAPQYLSSLLHSHQPSRTLRYFSQALLTVDRTRLKTNECGAFSVAGPDNGMNCCMLTSVLEHYHRSSYN